MKTKGAVILSVLLISAGYLVSRRSIPHKAPDFRDAPQEISALESLEKANPGAVAEKVKIPDVPVAESVVLDAKVYRSLLHYKCKLGSGIFEKGALYIAELAAQDKIDVEAFKKAYYKSCDYDSALKVGIGEKARISQKGGEKI